MLALVGLADKANKLPRDLTQVEMRKLELARAMAADPKLLIADEAMAGLSHSEVDEIVALLIQLNERGITIIMIEHIMRAVMASRSAWSCWCPARRSPTASPQDVVAQSRGGGSLPWPVASPSRSVDAAYGAVRVLEDVSIDVKPGETVVLLGTNGNGKSTLMKCIMGIVRPTRRDASSPRSTA